MAFIHGVLALFVQFIDNLEISMFKIRKIVCGGKDKEREGLGKSFLHVQITLVSGNDVSRAASDSAVPFTRSMKERLLTGFSIHWKIDIVMKLAALEILNKEVDRCTCWQTKKPRSLKFPCSLRTYSEWNHNTLRCIQNIPKAWTKAHKGIHCWTFGPQRAKELLIQGCLAYGV